MLSDQQVDLPARFFFTFQIVYAIFRKNISSQDTVVKNMNPNLSFILFRAKGGGVWGVRRGVFYLCV